MFLQSLWISVFLALSGTAPTKPLTDLSLFSTPDPSPPPTLQYLGGPDADGWYYVDSREPNGPSFQYLWISTPMGLTGDDEGAWIPLPFPFSYRGQSYDSVFVCTNGFISFTSSSVNPTNTPVPNPSAPNAAIYVYWDDLVIEPGFSAIDTGTVGVAPNRRFVIRWYRPKHYPDYYRVADFQVVLYEQGEKVLINIKQAQFDLPAFDYGASATVGMENADGTVGLLYSYNDTTRIDNYLAILFYRPDSSHNVAPVDILAPVDNQPTGTPFSPQVQVTNLGTSTESFYTVLRIFPYLSSTPVYLDSVFASHVAPAETTLLTFAPWTPASPGQYRAQVYTRALLDEHRENDTLNQVFVAGTPGTDFLVLDLNPLHTDGRRVYEILQQQGYAGRYTSSIAYFDSLPSYATVWCLLGVYPNKHILSVYQALKLRDYLEQGGRVLLQSGDAFGEDPTRDTLGPYFGVDPEESEDGDTPVGILYGLSNPLIPEINEDDVWAYYGGRQNLDSLVLLHPTDAQVAPVMEVRPHYYTLVAYQGTRWLSAVSTVELTPVEQESDHRNNVDQDLVLALMNFLTGDLYTFHDVRPLAFRHPPGSVHLPGDTLRVQVSVTNEGTYSETLVPVVLAVYRQADSTEVVAGSWILVHADTAEISSLPPGDTVVVTFAPWTVPQIQDTLRFVAYTQLASDLYPSNDTLSKTTRGTLEPGDLLRVIFLDARTGTSENYGVGFDGQYFYVTTHNPHRLVVLNDTGAVVATLSLPTPSTGYYDLEAWREPGDTVVWIYTGRGGTLEKLRLDGFHNLSVVAQWDPPVNPVRGVALDPERQRFFLASGTSPVVELQRNGQVLSHIVPGREVYGLAYVPPVRGWWSPQLWLSAAVASETAFQNRLYRWDLSTGTLTDSLMPPVPAEITRTYPGGLSHRMVYRSWQVLVELVQAEPSDYLQVIYLGDASWDRKCGDANGDGYASWSDFDLLADYLFRGGSLDNPLALDVNLDYQTDPQDLWRLARFLWDDVDSLKCRPNP